jgi:hypothetical protein
LGFGEWFVGGGLVVGLAVAEHGEQDVDASLGYRVTLERAA